MPKELSSGLGGAKSDNKDVPPKQAVEDAIKKLKPEEQKSLARNLNTLGFQVEKRKSEMLGSGFDWASKKFGKQSTMARFTRGMRDSFKRDADIAKKRLEAKDISALTIASSYGRLAGMAARIVRVTADITGASPTSAFKWVMATSMVASRVTGAMKEARFANEELVAKTRNEHNEIEDIQRSEQMQESFVMEINQKEKELVSIYTEIQALSADDPNRVELQKKYDELLKERVAIKEKIQLEEEKQERLEENMWSIADNAHKEALAIYEKAQEKAGVGKEGEVSAEQIQKAYIAGIPKDLEERLKKSPAAVNVFSGRTLRKIMEVDLKALNGRIEAVEADKRLTPAKKEAKKEEWLRMWERRLLDYDRMLTQTGTVDKLAARGFLAEGAARNAVRFMTLNSIYLGFGKLWESMGHSSTGDGATDKWWAEQEVKVKAEQAEHVALHTKQDVATDAWWKSQEAEQAEKVPSIVKKGDNLWKIIENNLDSNKAMEGLEEGARTHMIDALKDRFEKMSPDELKALGFSSGDADILKVGDKLDLSKILGSPDTVMKTLLEAKKLSPDEIKSIVANNAKIAKWFSEHHGELTQAIDNETVDGILKDVPTSDVTERELDRLATEAKLVNKILKNMPAPDSGDIEEIDKMPLITPETPDTLPEPVDLETHEGIRQSPEQAEALSRGGSEVDTIHKFSDADETTEAYDSSEENIAGLRVLPS